jgi:tRNA-specific 2-thiouridylase
VRVLAALSGGVDSAVAAARAVDAGHDVTAVHLALSRNPRSHREGARGCCSLEDSRDARRVADVLGVPFYVWDVAEEFTADVIDDFVAEYAAGRTPNPCLRCNEKIKFSTVLERARALGFDAVCTGHYARIVDGPAGRELHRAVDADKDQSYVLGVLDADQLAGAMFPLGTSVKSDVRRAAAERGLLVADKPDSHDICFIPDGDTAGWLTERLGARPGDVVDAATGARLGSHDGAYAFTVGQRRGLHLGSPAPGGERRYVVGVDTDTSTVLVGLPTLLEVDEIHADRPRWCGVRPSVGDRVLAQVRAHGEPVPAEVHEVDDVVVVALQSALRGVAPGQALVLYAGQQVLGSATITRATRRDTRQ